MPKIVVFDSGLGSLSIIKAIQKTFKSEIIYFADQAHFPYGLKSQAQLDKIIRNCINTLDTRFSPDILVMASNTPSLMLKSLPKNVVGVKPPLIEAQKISKTKKIAILATKSAVKSNGLSRYIKRNKLSKFLKIFKINGSDLVDLVETGKFLEDEKFCKKIIQKVLQDVILKNSIDTVTLSSTHLPFLKKQLENEFPHVTFIDPGNIIAQKLFKITKNKISKRNSLKIFSSGNPKQLEKKLIKLKIKNKVTMLTI